MIYQDISFSDPVHNLAYDDLLLQSAEKTDGGEVLRFWESPTFFVVLGKIRKINEDVKQEVVSQDKVPVLRRSSGGGTVVQGPGCLNFTLILSKDKHPIEDLRRSYVYILEKLQAALSKLDITTQIFPISDLALQGSAKKISGNAQKRGKNYILHHGTVLYGFDLSMIERYLQYPNEVPEYRDKRAHLDFVTNVSMDIDRFKVQLCEQFGAQDSGNITEPDWANIDLERYSEGHF